MYPSFGGQEDRFAVRAYDIIAFLGIVPCPLAAVEEFLPLLFGGHIGAVVFDGLIIGKELHLGFCSFLFGDLIGFLPLGAGFQTQIYIIGLYLRFHFESFLKSRCTLTRYKAYCQQQIPNLFHNLMFFSQLFKIWGKDSKKK